MSTVHNIKKAWRIRCRTLAYRVCFNL